MAHITSNLLMPLMSSTNFTWPILKYLIFPKIFSIAILFGLPVNGHFFPFKEAVLSAIDNMTFREDSTFFVTLSLMEV